MKLYDFALAPNPKRVRVFLAEKGISLPTVQVNLRELEQFEDSFQQVSTFGTVPVLVLDDGTTIGESVAICRYFERLHPEPALMGTDAKDMAIVEMWNRRAEIQCFSACGEAVRNSAPMFAGRALAGERGVDQIPALIDRGRATARRFMARIDTQLADNPFLAGANFTIADITAFIAIEFGARAEISIPDGCANVARWFDSVASRASASA